MGSKAPKPAPLPEVTPPPAPPQEEKESDAKTREAVDKSQQRALARSAASQTIMTSAMGDLTNANVGKVKLGA